MSCSRTASLHGYDNAMELLHIGIKGRVVALDGRTGQKTWETPLKGAGFVNLTMEGDVILAATRGEVWGVDPKGGQILWHNQLPGMGLGHITFASSPDKNLAVIVAAIEQQQQQAAVSG